MILLQFEWQSRTSHLINKNRLPPKLPDQNQNSQDNIPVRKHPLQQALKSFANEPESFSQTWLQHMSFPSAEEKQDKNLLNKKNLPFTSEVIPVSSRAATTYAVNEIFPWIPPWSATHSVRCLTVLRLNSF